MAFWLTDQPDLGLTQSEAEIKKIRQIIFLLHSMMPLHLWVIKLVVLKGSPQTGLLNIES